MTTNNRIVNVHKKLPNGETVLKPFIYRKMDGEKLLSGNTVYTPEEFFSAITKVESSP